MLELSVWMAILTAFYGAPILHWWIRRTKFWGVRTIIAGLVFMPGVCATALGVWFVVTMHSPVTRWSLVYFLQGAGALRCLVAISGITATYLGGCVLLENFPKREDRDGELGVVRVIRVWPSLVAIQLALTAAAIYLYHYKTLEDAVVSDNLALTEERLNWNLEGLGPNNGLMVDTWRPELYPLLPEAVRNGNYDMVKLLVKHGAELAPRDREAATGPGLEIHVKNPLYFAIKNHDVEMIDLLLDLGVEPEHGISPVLSEQNRELLDLLLNRGVSREFALRMAKQQYFNQQQLDRLFGEDTPEPGGEVGE